MSSSPDSSACSDSRSYLDLEDYRFQSDGDSDDGRSYSSYSVYDINQSPALLQSGFVWPSPDMQINSAAMGPPKLGRRKSPKAGDFICIDGQQRLITLYGFLCGKIPGPYNAASLVAISDYLHIESAYDRHSCGTPQWLRGYDCDYVKLGAGAENTDNHDGVFFNSVEQDKIMRRKMRCVEYGLLSKEQRKLATSRVL
ncbi:hypothetical protein BJ165DRAFT_1530822 [Panaeolus papilionaceus]|nr:hypothetical protein BJ165DRAFT_1530822 [Panaeolus papilionaceus]